MTTPIQPILISDAQAREMFGLELNVPFQQVILLSGDTTIQGNLSQGWTEETLESLGITGASGNTLILVDGNLTVTGTIGPADESFTHLLVLGNVQCEVLKSYDEFIFITGDADIKYALDGFYNHGAITISGITRVPFVLNSDHSMSIKPEGATLINYYDNNERYLPYDFKAKDLERVIVPEVIDEQYGFGAKAFIDLLKAGKSPLKEGVRTTRQLQEDEMAQLGKGNTAVTELDLSAKKLKSFPGNISSIPTLKKLILNENIISVVPAAIKELVNLEELHLEGCGLKNLPDEIGQLQQLRVLNVANNPGIQLPESINQLTSLRTLIVYNNITFEFPSNLAGLNKLEELNCYHNSAAAPVEFPVWLTQLRALKRLNIGDNSFKAIPESILELQQLEELSLDTALCYVNELPDLSKLKKLKVLRAGGMRTYITRPAAKQSLLKSFFTITSLEELYIHHHGLWKETAMSEGIYEEMQQNLTHDPERLNDLDARLSNISGSNDKTGVLRNNLTTTHLEGISNLQQLNMLDLSWNGLTSLPDEIFTLKNLQFLNLQHNRLTISERSRIASNLPACVIDFRNNEPENETSEPEIIMEWQSMNKQLKFANMLRIVMGDRENY